MKYRAGDSCCGAPALEMMKWNKVQKQTKHQTRFNSFDKLKMCMNVFCSCLINFGCLKRFDMSHPNDASHPLVMDWTLWPFFITVVFIATNDHSRFFPLNKTLTFYIQTPHDLSVAITVPHFTNVRPRVTGLRALYQQPCDGLAEAAVRLQRAVVLQPAVFWSWVAWRLTGQLHPMINHHLSVVKAIQDAWLSIGGVWKEQRI